MAIQNLSNAKWFDGSNWQSGPTIWLDHSDLTSAPSPAAWDYTGLSVANLQTGTSYYIISKSLDDSGNWETNFVPGSETFWYDINVPTATLTTPANGSYLRQTQITTINGTAADTGNAVGGVKNLNLYIQRATDGLYWQDADYPPIGNGSWTATKTALVVSTTSLPNWSYTLHSESEIWTHNKPYKVWIEATDLPGNVQTAFVVGTSSNGFTYDIQPGISTVTLPANGEYYNASSKPLPMISGTATDESLSNRVAFVGYSIKESGSGNYWNVGASTFNSGTEIFYGMVHGSGNVWTSSYPALQDGLAYTVRMQATDLAGNVEPLNTPAQFTFDVSSPMAQINVPSNNAKLPSLPTISGTVSDNTGLSGVSKVELAIKVDTGTWYDELTKTFDIVDPGPEHFFTANNDGGFVTWSTASIPWVSGHTYWIKSRATDKASNVQTIFTPTISTITFLYDNTPPTVVISSPVANTRTNNLPNILGTANDNVAGNLQSVQIRIRREDSHPIYYDPIGTSRDNPGFTLYEADAPAWFVATTTGNYTTWSASFTWISSTTYSVQARSVDKAGNVSTIAYSTFTYDTGLPQSFVTVPSASVIKHLTGITGTATDSGNITDVQVAIQNLSNAKWFDGNDWQSGPTIWLAHSDLGLRHAGQLGLFGTQ